MFEELKSARYRTSVAMLAALTVSGCKNNDEKAILGEKVPPAAKQVHSEPTLNDGVLPAIPTEIEQPVAPLSTEQVQALRVEIDQALSERALLRDLVTSAPVCNPAVNSWMRVAAIKEVGGEAETGSSQRIAQKSAGSIYLGHRFITFPGGLIFDPTYRQFLSETESKVPDYFLGTLDELTALFKQHKTALAPHVRENILRIEVSEHVTDEHIKNFVYDLWGESL